MRRHLGLALVLLACDSRAPAPPAPAPAPKPKPHVTTNASNIAAADYIGPGACGACHADEFARWTLSLHRVMNAKSDDAGAMIGDFANAMLAYAGGEARFTHDAKGYTMTLNKGARVTQYRVTRTIGHRGLQEYVGIEDGHTDEVRLPFGWWPRRGGWFPQPYFDPWLQDEAAFDAYTPVREPWAERCPWCHSTYPFEQRIARSSSPSQLGHGMEQMFTAVAGSDRLVVERQVTTGISCESCHLGGRDHAAGGAIHFVPQGATARADAHVPHEAFADERRDANVVNAVCAQCHSGPSPRMVDQTSLRNSSEALDLAASPCTGIKCTDCHDPHRADARGELPRSLAACTHCHTALADAAAAISHAGAGHATTNCLDCHMPRIVMGIDHAVRTHRISSPTDKKILGGGALNACNLCHLDRSIAWTVAELDRGWEVHLNIDALDAAAGEQWLDSGQPAFRLIAAQAYARSPLGKAELPKLYRGLDDPLAYMRVWTQFAVEQILGRPVLPAEYDARAAPAVRQRQIAALPR